MKKLVVAFALLASSSSAFASISTESLNGATVMMRQVLNKNLLVDQDQKYGGDLVRALEGAGDFSTSDEITNIACEPGLGSIYCKISIAVRPLNGQASSFDLSVRTYQGEVISAGVKNQAQ